MNELRLTARDLAVLEEICAHRAVPVEHLAARFFQKNPFTGAANTNPTLACERRLAALSAAGIVMKVRQDDGRRVRTLVCAGPRAPKVMGAPAERHVPVRKLAHHARSLDALVLTERAVRARGGRVRSTRIEQQLRSDAQRGRWLRTGDRYAPFPDAECVAELPRAGGGTKTVRVAVEYATSKYTSEDIARKHAGFDGYDEVLWFADTPATCARVKRITGASCTLLV